MYACDPSVVLIPNQISKQKIRPRRESQPEPRSRPGQYGV